MKKKPLNPYKMKWICNIIFLTLIIIFIGNMLFDLITGRRDISCLGYSAILLALMINIWITTVKPFVVQIEKMEKNKRK